MKNNKTLLIVILVVLALCCCVIVVLAGAYFGLKEFQKYIPTLTSNIPTIPSGNGSTPTPFVVTRQPVDQIPADTLNLLEQVNVPEAELPEIVCRLKDVCGVPATETGPSSPLTVGTQEKFWVTDTDTNKDFQVDATLRYVTDHVYFWAENGADYNDSNMRKLIDTFENKIYPTSRRGRRRSSLHPLRQRHRVQRGRLLLLRR
jgi:hypothetical protein